MRHYYKQEANIGPSNDNDGKYIVMAGALEQTRLIDQHSILTSAMGGLLSGLPSSFSPRGILDLACGPGSWAAEVAFQYPDAEVIGVDLDENVIKYARSLAKVQHLSNVKFQVMDIKTKLAFNANTFDLINGRLLVGFMDQHSWPRLLEECWRLLQPGGILRLAEVDVTISNSESLQRLHEMMYQALSSQRRTYSVDGHALGIAYKLPSLLKDAGFEAVEKKTFHLDASHGAQFYRGHHLVAQSFLYLLKPYMLKSQSQISEQEYDDLCRQAADDASKEGFICLSYGLTAWGKKPGLSKR